MSDLRTRIAKALFRHGFENLVWEDESDDLRNVLLGEADAVIAELALNDVTQALVAADSILSLLANRASTWGEQRSHEEVEKASVRIASLRQNPIYTDWKADGE